MSPRNYAVQGRLPNQAVQGTLGRTKVRNDNIWVTLRDEEIVVTAFWYKLNQQESHSLVSLDRTLNMPNKKKKWWKTKITMYELGTGKGFQTYQ